MEKREYDCAGEVMQEIQEIESLIEHDETIVNRLTLTELCTEMFTIICC